MMWNQNFTIKPKYIIKIKTSDMFILSKFQTLPYQKGFSSYRNQRVHAEVQCTTEARQEVNNISVGIVASNHVWPLFHKRFYEVS